MGDVYRMMQRASSPKELGGEGDLVLAMAVILATITGARRGELAGLRWEDIDEDTCSLRIERQWVPGKGGQHLGPPKSSDGPRTVVLGEVGMALITRYRHLIGELLNREPKGWLLSHDAGTTPLRAKALGAAISRLGTSLGTGVSTHSFRRASATELMASGVDWTRPLVAWATPPKSCCRATSSDRTTARLPRLGRWRLGWPHADYLLPNYCQCRSKSPSRSNPTHKRIHVERAIRLVQRVCLIRSSPVQKGRGLVSSQA